MIVQQVWIVIPLILFGIIGMQESFAEEWEIYPITSEDRIFDIKYQISNGTVQNMINDIDANSFLINIQSFDKGILSIQVPKKLLNPILSNCQPDSFFVLGDGEETKFVERHEREFRSLIIPFEKGVATIEIIGQFVPETRQYEQACISMLAKLSPKQQWESGITDKITCKEGLELIFKSTNDSPACVKPSSVEKLIERGWGIIHEQNISEIPEPKIPKVIDSTNVIDANNQFAIDFYSKVAEDNSDNIFFSPWSISTAFAIAYEGTRGNTADEIRQVFEFPADNEQRRTEFKSINDNLNAKDAKYNLTVANALWIQTGFEPLPDYVNTAKTFYDSEVSSVNLQSPEGAKIVNEWIEEKTQEKIKDLFPKPGVPDAILAITNAIYFKGTWMTQFDKDDTRDEDFWISDDESVNTPMMRLDVNYFNYADTENLQILELPYEGDKISMLMLLPHDKDGLQSIEESLTVDELNTWKDKLTNSSVIVQIPKFKLETKYNLISPLKDLGIQDAFVPWIADFTGITDSGGVYIAKALHKAFVDVNEEGTEAAAATVIVMGIESAGPVYPVFKADHPFIFIIQDNETENILFIGRVVDPPEIKE